MKRLTASLLAAGLAFGAHAEDSSRDAELLTAVSMDDIRYIAESQDHTISNDLTDRVGIAVESPDGLIYAMEGKVCKDSPDCLGLEIYAFFTGDYDAEDASGINRRYAAIKATSNEDGALVLSRYLILDDGQTMGNLKTNVRNAIGIAVQVQAELTEAAKETAAARTAVQTEQPPADQIEWGDNSGSYANDDACDDARFKEEGDDWDYMRSHVLRDANDCRTAYQNGLVTLFVDFGDNSGEYADDQTCDDNRFSGEGRSILTTDSHVKIDSADCVAAYRDGRLNR